MKNDERLEELRDLWFKRAKFILNAPEAAWDCMLTPEFVELGYVLGFGGHECEVDDDKPEWS